MQGKLPLFDKIIVSFFGNKSKTTSHVFMKFELWYNFRVVIKELISEVASPKKSMTYFSMCDGP